MMKFIITGGCGFIGSHLSGHLIDQGYEVVVVDDLRTGSMANVESLSAYPKFTCINTDVLSFNNWHHIIEKNDCIIHLAATVGVDHVMQDPISTLENNYKPTLRLLDLAKQFKCRFIFASTSEVYGELVEKPFIETDRLSIPGKMNGRSAYVLGKILSEHYCLEYASNHQVPVTIIRLFNVIGFRQVAAYGMVVPTFIEQAGNNQPITLYNSGIQTRTFCDVSDIVNAIDLLLQNNRTSGHIFNLGGNEEISIRELARYIKQAMQSTSEIVNLPSPVQRKAGNDIFHRKACLDKIKLYTGWEPTISWRESIDRLISVKKYLPTAQSEV